MTFGIDFGCFLYLFFAVNVFPEILITFEARDVRINGDFINWNIKAGNPHLKTVEIFSSNKGQRRLNYVNYSRLYGFSGIFTVTVDTGSHGLLSIASKHK